MSPQPPSSQFKWLAPRTADNPSGYVSTTKHVPEADDRLPHGMHHVGYDADAERHLYRDVEGQEWQSEEGMRFGELHPVVDHRQSHDQAGTRSGLGSRGGKWRSAAGQTSAPLHRSSWRYLLPLLIPLIIFISLWKYIPSSTTGLGAAPHSNGEALYCPKNTVTYPVKAGETCWSIAEAHGVTVGDIEVLNQELDCQLLQVGKGICVSSVKG